MELRIKQSDEMFEIVYEIAYRIAACKNPHMFFGVGDVSEVERLAEVARLESLFEESMH
jgi:hypothetical protein